MEFKKIDKDTIEITNKQLVFKSDLLSEKAKKEKRLEEVNAMLKSLE